MTKNRKLAYIYLLYWGLLEIRGAEWCFFVRRKKWKLLNPKFWRHEIRRARYSGAVGEALHNLALFASHDFDRFEEEWFWGEIAALRRKYPDLAFDARALFEGRLKELEGGTAPEHAWSNSKTEAETAKKTEGEQCEDGQPDPASS